MNELLLKEHKNNCNSLSNLNSSTQRAAFLRPRDFPQLSFSEAEAWQLDRLTSEQRSSYSDSYIKDRFTPSCAIGVFRDNANGAIKGVLPCNMWSCPVCAAKKKKKLVDGVKKSFADQQCYFMTLTVGPKFADKDITKAYARLRASLTKYGYFKRSKGHIYFWVKEFTPPSHEYIDRYGRVRQSVGNVRHIHMLLNFFVPSTIRYTTPGGLQRDVTLSSLWKKATDGTSHNIHLTSDTEQHGAVRASYMVKYITKSCDGETSAHDFQPYERRFGKSILLFRMSVDSKHTCWVQFLGDKEVPVSTGTVRIDRHYDPYAL